MDNKLYVLLKKKKKGTNYWSQISVINRKLNLRPSNHQLMPWNFQIQYSYLLNTSYENIKFHINIRRIFIIKLFTKNKWWKDYFYYHILLISNNISYYAVLLQVCNLTTLELILELSIFVQLWLDFSLFKWLSESV